VTDEIAADNLLGLSDEDSEKKFPLTKLLEYFPRCSGNVTASNFSPYWLVVYHYFIL